MKSNTKSSREKSIDINAEDTLNRLRDLDFDSRHSRNSSSNAHTRQMEKMGQSLNFLNLDRRSTMTPLTAPTKTVGGGNPRMALMQLRIKRLKKTSPTERLYQSDSALFGGDQRHNKANARDAVWFKSSYPTRQTLEKLEEAEQEYEESTHRSSVMGDGDNIYGDMPELDDFNTSSTDLWLHGNQSAPGDFQRRPANSAAYMDDEHDEHDDDDDDTDNNTGGTGTGNTGGGGGKSDQKGKEMVDESIQIV